MMNNLRYQGISNEELSKSVLCCCNYFTTEFVYSARQIMLDPKNVGYFIEKLRGRKLADIGGAAQGFLNLDMLIEGIRTKPEIPIIGVSEGIIVDPHGIPEAYEDMNIRSSKTDALTFLTQQPDNSFNILTSGIDEIIIPRIDVCKEYCRRVVEEMYRVVLKGGIYISYYSYPFEVYAKEIFKRIKVFESYYKLYAFEKD